MCTRVHACAHVRMRVNTRARVHGCATPQLQAGSLPVPWHAQGIGASRRQTGTRGRAGTTVAFARVATCSHVPLSPPLWVLGGYRGVSPCECRAGCDALVFVTPQAQRGRPRPVPWRGVARGRPSAWGPSSRGCWSVGPSAASSLAGPPWSSSSRTWATSRTCASPPLPPAPTGPCCPVGSPSRGHRWPRATSLRWRGLAFVLPRVLHVPVSWGAAGPCPRGAGGPRCHMSPLPGALWCPRFPLSLSLGPHALLCPMSPLLGDP